MTETMLGYLVEDEIFRSERTLVLRARHPETGERAVLKVLRDPSASRQKVLWFQREYEVLRRLDDVDTVIGAREYGRARDRWVMALEDIGGESLAETIARRPLRSTDFLTIATRVAAALAQTHAHHLIHKDVNPSNIIVNRGTGQVRLIDYGLASELVGEVARFESPGAMEGTLRYISPEQTGRMNRAIDHRTDLYSLGVTFFHVLAGRPPFDVDDPVRLIHAHIARQPPVLAEVAPRVDPMLSRIVARLMAKAPEERYQSAEGLRRDLEECLRLERETGEITEFELDRHHTPTHLVLPQRLYGREAETARLMGAFERAMSDGPVAVMVAGYSGVGKSALVQQLHRPITARSGFFVSGKFDQLRRDQPYAVVAQAFRALARQILSEPEDRLVAWRAGLAEALGPNGAVLVDAVPEFEPIVGEQPPAPELSSAEARIRLHSVFTRTLAVFARPEHPVTLFLDDLQWIDPGSLDLLDSLLSSGQIGTLLVIGAYRDNEVAPGHALSLWIDRLATSGLSVETISLAPLAVGDIAALVGDATGRPPEAVRSLAELVVEKTGGNPFFAREFLQELHRDEQVRLRDGQWTWDHRAIRARGITDNVVDLVTARMRALTPQTQSVLQHAGALGARFDLETLAVALGWPIAQVWEALWPAVKGRFVVVLNDAYKLLGLELEEDEIEVPFRFAHDRIQQAAHGLVPEEVRDAHEWQIGQRLSVRWPIEDSHERLFDVVGHLNAGAAVAPDQAARDRLAEYNLLAARKARLAAAFHSAYEHAVVGVGLLGEDGDQRQNDLALSLLTECVETAYQTGRYDEMEQWFGRAEAAATDVLDTAWIHEIKTEALNAMGRPLDALAHALDFLEKLGVRLPREPGYDEVVAEMGAAAALLEGRDIDALASAEDIRDPAIRVAVGLICKVYSSAYVASPFVFAVLTLRQFQLVVAHGNCPVSALSYAVYGLLRAGLANDVESAYRFGALSSRMLDRPDIKRFEAQALHLFNCHTRMWKEHLRECADGERRAYRVGCETGEMEFGSYGAHVASKYAFFHGAALEPLRSEMAQYATAMKRFRQDIAGASHAPWRQAVLNLTQPTEEPHRLKGEVLDAEAVRADLEAAGNRMAISNALTAELMLCVLFERFDDAVARGSQGAQYLDAVLSQFNQPIHYFFDSLARVAHSYDVDEQARAGLRETVEANLALLTQWSASAPVNLAQKVALLEAELLALDGRVAEARGRYDDAIELARRHEFLLDEALAYESAARFYRRIGRDVPARHYRIDARDAYARWGATTRVAALEAAHSAVVPSADRGASLTATATATQSASSGSTAIDHATLVRAAQAISGEVVLERLLHRLVTTLMENAGATRVVLLRVAESEVTVQASGDVDGEVTVVAEVEVEAGDVPAVPMSLLHLALRSREVVVAHEAQENPQFAADPYVAAHQTRSAMVVPIERRGELSGAIYLENSAVGGAFTPERAQLIRLLAGQIAISIDNASLYANLEERVAERTEQLEARNGFIRQVFGRYMSDDVVDTLLESPTALRLGGERRMVSLVFTDLRGFTAMCEQLSPEQVLRSLNNYLSVLTRVVHRYRGTINNIVGDGLLILFGAPIWREDDADRAVQCALEMQLAMDEVNRLNASEGLPALDLAIGIHTGEVVVGNVGSERRAKYSVIGRNANIASRVETVASGGEIFVSEATCEATRCDLMVTSERRIHPKGMADPLSVVQICGIRGRDDLNLPNAGDERVRLEGPRPIRLRRVLGKDVADGELQGALVALGPRSLELTIDAEVAPGDDLALQTDAGFVYAKVASVGDTVVARLTGGDVSRL